MVFSSSISPLISLSWFYQSLQEGVEIFKLHYGHLCCPFHQLLLHEL